MIAQPAGAPRQPVPARRHPPRASFDETVEDVQAVDRWRSCSTSTAASTAPPRRVRAPSATSTPAAVRAGARSAPSATGAAGGGPRRTCACRSRWSRSRRRACMRHARQAERQPARPAAAAARRPDADYPALLMANYLFGSRRHSRLWTRMRERDGLSYDVRSGVDWNAVRAELALDRQRDLRAAEPAEGRGGAARGVGALARRKASRRRSSTRPARPAERAAAGACAGRRVAGQLACNLYLGRTFAFAQQVDEAIDRLTLEQVNAAWRKYIDPAQVVLAWAATSRRRPERRWRG